MEEHTREATLPHINGNVVRQWGPRLVTMIRALSTDLRPVFAFLRFCAQTYFQQVGKHF